MQMRYFCSISIHNKTLRLICHVSKVYLYIGRRYKGHSKIWSGKQIPDSAVGSSCDFGLKIAGSNPTAVKIFLFCNSRLLRVPRSSTKPIQVKSAIILV